MTARAAPLLDMHRDPAEATLVALLRELVDQERAVVAVARTPPRTATGSARGTR